MKDTPRVCISIGPSRMSNTILVAHQTEHQGRTVNVLGYSNRSVSVAPNAMILPIPSGQRMTSANCIDMTGVGDAFAQYAELVKPRRRGGLTKGLDVDCFSFGIEYFESGSYSVLLTHRADLAEIQAALDQFPADKRIVWDAAKTKVLESFQETYPGWHVAICVWAGEVDAEPILWWYEPMPEFVDHHFLPGLDAHDGQPPDLNAEVEVDHTLIIGVDNGYDASRIVAEVPEHLRKWLPSKVGGGVLSGYQKNGDWRVPKNLPSGSHISGLHRETPPWKG